MEIAIGTIGIGIEMQMAKGRIEMGTGMRYRDRKIER